MNVAVIFADISGFTALAEKLDPEEVREIINDCFSYITRPVYELEGTIDKYIGDCVMILFGARYVHSDDAKRAVLCAMKMRDLIQEFSEQRFPSDEYRLNLSIGINYGLVVTGSVGNYFDKDYTVMGDIVNTAQRLQSSAGEGVIMVSESVYMETRDMMEYSEPREVVVKNKGNPVRCYLPLKLNSKYLFEHEMAFVGRKAELSLLNSLYNHALNAGTQYITILGEAGIGKTRLLKEFTLKIGNNIKKVWVGCNSTSQNRPYYLIANILMNIMNINQQDSVSIKQHRLISFLDYILGHLSDEEIKRNYDFLGLLLGLNRDNEFQSILSSMNYDDIHREILKQSSLFFVNLCKKHRFILVVDDLHWADANSLQIINGLIPVIPDLNAVFIFASRHKVEAIHLDDEKRHHVILLEALDESAVRSMACRLLNCSNIDPALQDALLRYTRGNPLYIKEFVSNIRRTGKYHIKDGTAVSETGEITSIPSSIQSLILSNISGLDEREILMLQAASVVGNEFSLTLLKHLLEDAFESEDLLKLPIQMNIISLKSVHTSSGVVEKIFAFNHDTEREAIYDSVLNRNKKHFHKRIAEYLESNYRKEIQNYYEILCTHFFRAGMNKKAADYYYKTAVKHKNDFNFSNAMEYFNKYLQMVSTEEDLHRDKKTICAYRDIGYIYSVMEEYDQALRYLNKALGLAQLSNDIYSIKIMIADVYKDKGMYNKALDLLNEMEPRIRQESSIYGRLLQMKCNILRIMGNPEALNLAEKSEKLLLKTRDYVNLSETMKYAGMIYFAKGDIDNALFFMNKSFKYAEEAGDMESMAKVSGELGNIYHSTGLMSSAYEFYNKSLEISKKISYPRGLIAACINLGVLFTGKGLFNKAEAFFSESLSTSREIAMRLYECISLTNLGDIEYERGSYDHAVDLYSQSLKIARHINAPVEEGLNNIGLAKIYLKLRQYENVSEFLESAFRIFTDSGKVMYLGDCYYLKAMHEMLHRQYKEALANCEKAIEISLQCKSDMRRLKALRLKGFILLKTKNPKLAVEMFDQAIILAQQVDSEYETAKGYYGRSRAFSLMKQLERALVDLKKARESIQHADQCRWTAIVGQDEMQQEQITG